MRGLYKAIGVGLVSLPLILGGCGERKADYKQQEPVAKQVQLEPQVRLTPISESELETISTNLYSRLSKGEITSRDYDKFVFEQLKSLGVVPPEISGWYIGSTLEAKYMADFFGNRLRLKILQGLNQFYLVLDSVPISDVAKKDIDAYERIKTEVGKYLERKVGKKQISADEFGILIQEYVLTKIPNLSLGKRFDLARSLSENYIGKFNVISNGTGKIR